MEPNPSPGAQLELNHLLSTNAAPAESECISLRTFIEERQEYAEALKSRANALRFELERTAREELDVAADIRKATMALGPIRRLPPEIICEIFYWAAKYRRKSYTRDLAPWWLGQISSRWRKIALSFPRLWSKFRVDGEDELLKRSPELMKERISTQLARSGNALLSLELSFYQAFHGKLLESAAPAMSLLVSRSAQWRKLSFTALKQTEAFLTLIQPVKGRLPQLKKLSCHFYSRLNDDLDLDIFLDAPQLSQLSLSTRHNQLRFPWMTIRECYLEGNLDEFLPSLAETHVLAELHLNTHCSVLELPHSMMVRLPSLQRLRAIQTIELSVLTAPNLEHLNTSTKDLHHLSSFLQRSACPLSLLGLEEENGHKIKISHLVQGLGYVPSLNLLAMFPRLRDWTGERFLDDEPRIHDVRPLFAALKLSAEVGAADLVPRLSTFIFGFEQNPFVHEEFLVMVSSRLKPSNPHRLNFIQNQSPSARTLGQGAG
uniref:F-box domain-containing protein n=2 Tax=Mycena chlorophos TaxID=658473 RepID=A0ABQ0LPB9_MYCCL|nr:predicted protein [Mycena chlorophos]